MKIMELILLGILFFLVIVTIYYWKKQKKLKKKHHRKPKYEVVEVSDLDEQYDEYYEPKIVEIVSSDEYL